MRELFPAENAEIDKLEQLISDVMSGSEFEPEQLTGIGKLQEIIKKALDWLDKILNKISEFLEKLFGRGSGLFGGGTLSGAELAARWIAIVLVVLALGAIIFAIIRTARKKNGRNRDGIGEELAGFTSDPSRACSIAKDYLEQGDNYRALRYLFIALLARLNKAGAIYAEPAKTNRRYLKEVSLSGIVSQEQVLPFFRLFDRCRYGGKDVPEKELRELFGKYEALDAGLNEYEARKAEAEKAAGRQREGGQ